MLNLVLDELNLTTVILPTSPCSDYVNGSSEEWAMILLFPLLSFLLLISTIYGVCLGVFWLDLMGALVW